MSKFFERGISHQTLTSDFVFIVFLLRPPVQTKPILVIEPPSTVKTVHHLMTQSSESSVKQGLRNVKLEANPNEAINESGQDGKVVVSQSIVGVP